MAMSDAAVATFDTKYKYNTWRPETAIHLGQADGNEAREEDPSFAPLIAAPCFPGYPSAHAVLSNAVRKVERDYGGYRRCTRLWRDSFPTVGEYLYKDFMDSASASSCEGR
jgi:hypothetical protein